MLQISKCQYDDGFHHQLPTATPQLLISFGIIKPSEMQPRNAYPLVKSWKTPRPVTRATRDPGRSTSCLLFLPDANSGHRFLINTTADVSVVPPLWLTKIKSRTVWVYQQLIGLLLRLSAPNPSH